MTLRFRLGLFSSAIFSFQFSTTFVDKAHIKIAISLMGIGKLCLLTKTAIFS